jgi:hypothetical protein
MQPRAVKRDAMGRPDRPELILDRLVRLEHKKAQGRTQPHAFVSLEWKVLQIEL